MWKDKALKIAIKEEIHTLQSLQSERREILYNINNGYYKDPAAASRHLKWVEGKIFECEKRLGLWDNQNNPS